jgi:hypothetical protein
MIEPIFLTATAAVVKTLSELGKQYVERSKEAKEHYQRRTAGQAADPLEGKRDSCIGRVNELQLRTALYVSEPDLQQRIWCLLMEQTVATYEASTEQELRMAEASLQQIEAALASYTDARANRQRVRAIGVAISFLVLAGIATFLYYAPALGVTADSIINILGIPVTVVLWSVVGSFAAILYRFSMSGDRQLEDPLRWFFSRPLTGVVMGSITFLVIKVGLLTFTPGATSETAVASVANKELMWLVAFLAGFSDRFSDSLLKSLIGKFGGETTSELVTTPIAVPQKESSQFSVIFDWMTNNRRKKGQDGGTVREPQVDPEQSVISTNVSKTSKLNLNTIKNGPPAATNEKPVEKIIKPERTNTDGTEERVRKPEK